MSGEGLIVATFVLAAAAFAVSLWSLALGLNNAERRRADSIMSTVDRLEGRIRTLKDELSVRERSVEEEPDSTDARRDYNEAALDLAEAYEDLCSLLLRQRRTADVQLAGVYTREIRDWIEDGPLRARYRMRVTQYPATTELWRDMRGSEYDEDRAA